jgi:hypothetical protein
MGYGLQSKAGNERESGTQGGNSSLNEAAASEESRFSEPRPALPTVRSAPRQASSTGTWPPNTSRSFCCSFARIRLVIDEAWHSPHSTLARSGAGLARASFRAGRVRLPLLGCAGGNHLGFRRVSLVGDAATCGRRCWGQSWAVPGLSLRLQSPIQGSQPYSPADADRNNVSDVHPVPHGRRSQRRLVRMFLRTAVRHLSPRCARLPSDYAIHPGGLRFGHSDADSSATGSRP